MRKQLLIALIFLFCACSKNNSVQLYTTVHGQVTNMQTQAGILNEKIYIYADVINSQSSQPSTIEKLVDSTVSDSNGYYSIRFLKIANTTSYYLGCPPISGPSPNLAMRPINTGTDNTINIQIPHQTVLKAHYTIINNKNPPLQIFPNRPLYNWYEFDINALSADTTLFFTVYVNSSYTNTYAYANPKIHETPETFSVGKQDTISAHFTIDASSF